MDDALRVAVGERHDDAILQPGQGRRVLAHQGVGEAGRVVEPDVVWALAAKLGEDRVGLFASAGPKEHLGHVRPWVGQPTSAGRDGRLPRLEGLVVTLQPAQSLGQGPVELGQVQLVIGAGVGHAGAKCLDPRPLVVTGGDCRVHQGVALSGALSGIDDRHAKSCHAEVSPSDTCGGAGVVPPGTVRQPGPRVRWRHVERITVGRGTVARRRPCDG